MDMGLTGKRAIVTGASRGIGRAIAETLAADGCHVAICARGEEGVRETVAALERYGVRAFGKAVDVRNDEALRAWFDASADALGGLDILISNVSTRIPADSAQVWRDTFDVDLLQHIHLVDLALPRLQDSDAASVVFISSIASILTQLPPGEMAYGTMKAALVNLCGQLANIHGPAGIRFNAVSPGPIDFPGGLWDTMKQTNRSLYDRAAALSVLGRLGTAEEVAKAVAYLASPAASYVTGANLRIDGGTVRAANF